MKVMKEIDFLPKWYKSSGWRQIGYRTQYAVLGGIFVMMMGWNFIAANSISKATAELAQMAPEQVEAEYTSQEFAGIKSQVTQLQKKAGILEKIAPKSSIKVADVLAEISFLIDEKIALSKLVLSSEPLVSSTKNSRLRIANPTQKLLGDVRFKMVIGGVASDASDVARLICNLEDSPYFCQVVPSFSRNTELKAATKLARGTTPNAKKDVREPAENRQVTEFEIGCYLANYQQEGAYFVKDAQNRRAER